MSRPVLMTHLAPGACSSPMSCLQFLRDRRVLELGENGSVEIGRNQFNRQIHALLLNPIIVT